MPRYEYSEGSSNKFWEINLSGKSYTTTYGKIGSNGQTTIKTYGSDAEAKKEYDKIVAEKTKKGYELVGGGNGTVAKEVKAVGTKPTKKATKKGKAAASEEDDEDSDGDNMVAKGDARNPALEKAIIENPTDASAYSVLADWLQDQGDPRGELISLMQGNKDKQAKAMIEKQAEYFLGPLAEHQKVHDEGLNNSSSHLRTSEQEKAWQKTASQAFLWRNGFIYRCRLSHDSYSDEEYDGETSELLEQVLAHPSGRFIVEFNFMSNGDPNENDLQSIIDVLAKKAPATTRRIVIGDNVDQISWHHTGNLGKLWKQVPNLRVLEIETGEFEVGKMDCPHLEKAIFITGGLSKSCGKAIATGSFPNIKHLELYYGDDNYGGDCTVKEVRPLLDRTDLKHLTRLGLKNAMFANDIAKALAGAKVLKTVTHLDMSLGAMTDEGAEALAAAKDSLKHLDTLDLTRNFLTKKGIAAVKGLAKNVITKDQEAADSDGDETYYYVGIAE